MDLLRFLPCAAPMHRALKQRLCVCQIDKVLWMAVPLQKLNHNGPIYCLAATSKGFLAGSVLGRVLQYQVPTTDTVRTCACTSSWPRATRTVLSSHSFPTQTWH